MKNALYGLPIKSNTLQAAIRSVLTSVHGANGILTPIPADTYPNSWMQPLTGKLIATGTLYATQELIG